MLNNIIQRITGVHSFYLSHIVSIYIVFNDGTNKLCIIKKINNTVLRNITFLKHKILYIFNFDFIC